MIYKYMYIHIYIIYIHTYTYLYIHIDTSLSGQCGGVGKGDIYRAQIKTCRVPAAIFEYNLGC